MSVSASSGVHAVLVPTAQKLGGGETRPESRQDERRPERAERHRLLRQNPAPPRLLVRLSARHQAAVRHLLHARSAVRPPRETRPITRVNAPNSRFRANLRRAPNRGMHHSPCFPRPPYVLPPNAPPKIKPPRDASAVPCRTRASRRAPRDAGRGAVPALLGWNRKSTFKAPRNTGSQSGKKTKGERKMSALFICRRVARTRRMASKSAARKAKPLRFVFTT